MKNLFFLFLALFQFIFVFAQTDTLHVSQNDTLIFEKQVFPARLHYSPIPFLQSGFRTHYELKKPQNGTYYFIYNDKNQLVMEGKFSICQFTLNDEIEEYGNFYDSKRYDYKKNGKLKSIHYQEDGRNLKTEFFDRKKRLTKVIYFEKKSSDKEKIEIYKKGKLKETRIYKSFSTCDIIKP